MAQEITSFYDFTQRFRFDATQPIGSGGFGQVYKAVDTESGEIVAIKKAAVVAKHERYSLYEEVRKGRSLQHPNLLQYHHVFRFVGDHGSFDYAVLEYVNGGTLKDFSRTRPSMEQIRHVLYGTLLGLRYLHSHRIVHRDLKPANILIQYGDGKIVPKIIDFGISKSMGGDESVISNVVGSWQYMSPEQISPRQGELIRVNSDLWTFGVILYELFTGRAAFGSAEEGVSQEQIRGRILDGQIPNDLHVLPEPFRTLAERCVVLDVNRRVQHADELLAILDADRSSSGDSFQSRETSVSGSPQMGASFGASYGGASQPHAHSAPPPRPAAHGFSGAPPSRGSMPPRSSAPAQPALPRLLGLRIGMALVGVLLISTFWMPTLGGDPTTSIQQSLDYYFQEVWLPDGLAEQAAEEENGGLILCLLFFPLAGLGLFAGGFMLLASLLRSVTWGRFALVALLLALFAGILMHPYLGAQGWSDEAWNEFLSAMSAGNILLLLMLPVIPMLTRVLRLKKRRARRA